MVVMITPTDPEDARRLAIRLLRAAGVERHDEVRTVWDERVGVLFVVPDDLAWGLLGPPPTGVEEPGGDAVNPATVTVDPGVCVVGKNIGSAAGVAESDALRVDGSGVGVGKLGARESERASRRASRAGAGRRVARPGVEFSER